ncbi:ADP-forming succinate--CoA ligase subunit beta [bacterium]|nr:ADP-forming succinate--CoA ligase subunit beta [candidate division CSSED10-310 bacterium]
MKIHEYQAKELMNRFGIPVSIGPVVQSVPIGMKAAEAFFNQGSNHLFIKAQVHAGGRGKAGGIARVSTLEETRVALDRLLGMTLISPQTGPEGRVVHQVMLADGSRIVTQELYLSVLLDRELEMPVILMSAGGGMEIEKLAVEQPDSIIRIHVDPCLGIRNYQTRNLGLKLGLDSAMSRKLDIVIRSVYDMFIQLDCSQIEINPLAIMHDGEFFALDAKVSLDESGFFRHPELAALRDIKEESPLEVRASQFNLNYIKLDGVIGCMVNGAGLAMATMDIIHHFGGEPANFLDVGGGASREAVTEAFTILLSDPHVKAVLVNIFGGIVRCDRVAAGIIEAAQQVCLDRPIVVRLAGTNALEGRTMLQESGLSIDTADSLGEAAERVVRLARQGGRS